MPGHGDCLNSEEINDCHGNRAWAVSRSDIIALTNVTSDFPLFSLEQF
jgi:hypothetical protein